MYDVELATSPVQVCLQYFAPVRVNHLSDDIGLRMDELYKAVAEAGMHPCGPPSITYPDRAGANGEMQIELDAPVVVVLDPGSKGVAGTGMRLYASGGELRAHTIHNGAYEHLGEAHAALDAWLAANHQRAIGPHRETYVLGPGEAGTPDDYLTDVSVPVMAA